MATLELDESTFEPTLKKDGITLIDWWAPWCGPCRAFGPIYEKSSERHPDVTFAKVNTEENRSLGAAFQVRSIPTLMVFRDGVLLFNQAGMLPAKALDEIIEKVKALDMAEVHAEIGKERARSGGD
jgi:thioredoxin 1